VSNSQASYGNPNAHSLFTGPAGPGPRARAAAARRAAAAMAAERAVRAEAARVHEARYFSTEAGETAAGAAARVTGAGLYGGPGANPATAEPLTMYSARASEGCYEMSQALPGSSGASSGVFNRNTAFSNPNKDNITGTQ